MFTIVRFEMVCTSHPREMLLLSNVRRYFIRGNSEFSVNKKFKRV